MKRNCEIKINYKNIINNIEQISQNETKLMETNLQIYYPELPPRTTNKIITISSLSQLSSLYTLSAFPLALYIQQYTAIIKSIICSVHMHKKQKADKCINYFY